MATLTSPGVAVSVIDESFYVPADAGTTPLFIVASAQDKTAGSGSSIASGTQTTNANNVYLITSQRELTETFGDPKFYTDASGNSLNGYELNEYGLQAAYSFLGVANRAYVTRANLNTSELVASATAVGSEPKSSGPLPLSANRFPETEASSFTENTSSTASGVEVIIMLAVAVLD